MNDERDGPAPSGDDGDDRHGEAIRGGIVDDNDDVHGSDQAAGDIEGGLSPSDVLEGENGRDDSVAGMALRYFETMDLDLYRIMDNAQVHFDVDTTEVIKQVIFALIPGTPRSQASKTPDMYGPLMMVLTLAALLVKSAGTGVEIMREEDAATYHSAVLLFSLVSSSAFFFFETSIAAIALKQYHRRKTITGANPWIYAASFVGYGFSGAVLCSLVTCLLPILYFPALLLFGGLSSARLALWLHRQLRPGLGYFVAVGLGFANFFMLPLLDRQLGRIFDGIIEASRASSGGDGTLYVDIPH